jgi:hypothetical protein
MGFPSVYWKNFHDGHDQVNNLSHSSGIVGMPPSTVLKGLAQLLQGMRKDAVPLNRWAEPWQSIGRCVAEAGEQGPQVLRECLQRGGGDELAEAIARGIFAIDLSEPSDEAPWELPIALETHNLPDFPVDAFPSWLQQFIRAEAEATQTPLDMGAMMALSVLGMALARKIEVRVKDGWFEPVNVWTITTMEPANRKSAIVRDLMAPAMAYQRDEAARLAPAIREAKARRNVLELKAERMRGYAAKARGEELKRLIEEVTKTTEDAAAVDVPVSPRLWTDDCTPEMMASLLSEHQGRMAIISAEGNILELMAGRYSKGQPNIGVYLAGHAGDAYMVDRRGRPSEYVPDPAITIGITVQNEILRSMASQPRFRGCGLLARFLYCNPQSRLGRRKTDPAPVPASLSETYHRNVYGLLSLPFRGEAEEQRAHIVAMTADAREALYQFQTELEPMLSPYGELGPINDWGGKLCGAVVRIAGLLHGARMAPDRTPWQEPVDTDTVNKRSVSGTI